jgi:cytochrome c oxidase subunit 6b
MEQLTVYSGFDARFPNQNQTKHCWQNYVDYHKCVNAKGEDFKPCRQVHTKAPSYLHRKWL